MSWDPNREAGERAIQAVLDGEMADESVRQAAIVAIAAALIHRAMELHGEHTEAVAATTRTYFALLGLLGVTKDELKRASRVVFKSLEAARTAG